MLTDKRIKEAITVNPGRIGEEVRRVMVYCEQMGKGTGRTFPFS